MIAPNRNPLTGQYRSAFLVVLGSCLLSTPVRAQVAGDTTIGTQVNGQITNPCASGLCSITGGTIAGGNLFHSFSRFSIPTSGEARFDTAGVAGIQNIISRVTGGFSSNIDGTISVIGASSGANLFLINPNGILFGSNASLNLGGSFIASTANSLFFADGSQFSAVAPTSSPLLTVSVPIGLQYGTNPGSIQVQGPGNNLSLDASGAFDHSQPSPLGALTVQPGKTLALIGGPVSIVGGNLIAPEGQVVVGSVGGASTVTLAPSTSGWSIGYQGVSSFGNVAISQAALLDASGAGGGAIQIQGQTVRVTDGSLIISDTLGSGMGAPVTVRATDTLEVSGFDPNNLNTSSIITDANPSATGSGGNLTIEAGSVRVLDGGSIATTTYGAGAAGSLVVQAPTVEVDRSAFIGFESLSSISTFVLPGATGQGGALSLQTQHLQITTGGTVSTSTFDAGNAGTLTVQATDIALSGQSPLDGQVSGVFSTVFAGATGNGGNVAITTGQFQATGGSTVAASTAGAGKAGNIILNATDIHLTGTSTDGAGGVFAQTSKSATGDGGNITITAQNVQLDQGANISASTSGTGNAGTLTLNTNQLMVIGTSAQGDPSGLFAQVGKAATGNGGTVAINTQSLQVSGGGTISVNTLGTGNAGNLTLQAQTIQLTGTSAQGDPSGLFAQTQTGATGNGGNLAVMTQTLQISDGATISASTFSSGNAGMLSIKATELELFGLSAQGKASGITAQVEAGATGNGGDLVIDADRLHLANAAQISTTTFSSGNAGNLTVRAGTVLLDGSSAGTRSGFFASAIAGTGDGGNLSVTADRLTIQNGAAIGVSNFQSRNFLPPGQGAAGNIQVDVRLLSLDQGGRITADSAGGSRGNITINATDLTLMRHGSLISTNAQGIATGGNITISTPFLVAPALENSDITANSVNNQGGRVIVNALGIFGIQSRPYLTPKSDITASSNLGAEFNGVVQINTPNFDPTKGIVKLPTTLIDQNARITASCEPTQGNTFIITGRGGLPQDATQTLRGSNVWTDLRFPEMADNSGTRSAERAGRSPQTAVYPTQTPIAEAQGWTRNKQGQVFLVVNALHSQTVSAPEPQCAKLASP